MGLREEGEGWRDGGGMERGGDLVQVFNTHFKYHMERISMYSTYVEEFNIKESRKLSANMLG